MKIHLVGGYLRDTYLNKYTKELDWVILNKKNINKIKFKKIGKDFPIFLDNINNEEYALARKEKKINKGYHGFKFFSSFIIKLKEDLKRRDININALSLNKYGIINDPFYSIIFFKKNTFLHISINFFEDPLRFFRIIKFLTKYNKFKISKIFFFFIIKIIQNKEIYYLSNYRILKELFNIINKNKYIFFFFKLKIVKKYIINDNRKYLFIELINKIKYKRFKNNYIKLFFNIIFIFETFIFSFFNQKENLLLNLNKYLKNLKIIHFLSKKNYNSLKNLINIQIINKNIFSYEEKLIFLLFYKINKQKKIQKINIINVLTKKKYIKYLILEKNKKLIYISKYIIN